MSICHSEIFIVIPQKYFGFVVRKVCHSCCRVFKSEDIQPSNSDGDCKGKVTILLSLLHSSVIVLPVLYLAEQIKKIKQLQYIIKSR